MTELRWPDGRGQFVDRDPDRVAAVLGGDARTLVCEPGDTIDVSDGDVADHYIDRGFEGVAPASPPDDTDDADASTGESEAFDPAAFVDRTPVEDVVDDIEAGAADGHLDAVAAADDRKMVHDAVDARRQELGGS